jgi:nucleoid DNA-binding protein
MVINLRQNKNAENAAYGKFFAEVDTKEPLNLKGLAAHMAEHNKVSTYEMIVLVLGEMVKCMVHLLKEGQPIKLDGLGTISPSADGQGNGTATIAEAVAKGAENMVNGIRLVFTPENTKGEKLTSRAFKAECLFEWGYLVESEKRTVNGKERRVQKKTPLSYILAPEDDGTEGGGDNTGGGGNTGGNSGGGGEQIPGGQG